MPGSSSGRRLQAVRGGLKLPGDWGGGARWWVKASVSTWKAPGGLSSKKGFGRAALPCWECLVVSWLSSASLLASQDLVTLYCLLVGLWRNSLSLHPSAHLAGRERLVARQARQESSLGGSWGLWSHRGAVAAAAAASGSARSATDINRTRPGGSLPLRRRRGRRARCRQPLGLGSLPRWAQGLRGL